MNGHEDSQAGETESKEIDIFEFLEEMNKTNVEYFDLQSMLMMGNRIQQL